ncbi:MAG: HPP family protein [Dehalococcoidales bacterium]|nr:MAG: HPP family protein [Dehalococcoidales bacterium]
MNIHLVDRTFLKKPKQYILQSLLAVIAVAVILYFVETITHAAIVAALGASSFIVFAMPKTVAAEPRRLIGGHIVGILCGLACYYGFFHTPLKEFFDSTEFLHWLPAALAVGLSILLMTILNFEHPPAAGTALGIVTSGWSMETVIFVVIFAVSLAIIGTLLKKYLKNLCT